MNQAGKFAVVSVAAALGLVGCQQSALPQQSISSDSAQSALESIQLPGRLLQFKDEHHWQDFDEKTQEEWATKPYAPFDPLSSNECNLLSQMGTIMRLPNEPRSLNPLVPVGIDVTSRTLILENMESDLSGEEHFNNVADGLYKDVLFGFGIWRFANSDEANNFFNTVATSIENCGPLTSTFDLPGGTTLSRTLRIESNDIREFGITYVISEQGSSSDGTSSLKSFTSYDFELLANAFIVARADYDQSDLSEFEIDESEFLSYTGTVVDSLTSILQAD
jgi:hypothetical protein